LIRALAAALLAAGCTSAPAAPPCDGTCLDVQVDAPGGLAPVEQLRVTGAVAKPPFTGQALFPRAPTDPIQFPAYFTLALGAVQGDLSLTVEALAAPKGPVVASAATSYAIVAGQRGSVEVTLAPGGGDGGALDLVARDASADGATDLATAPDFAESDLAVAPDFAGVDLTSYGLLRYASFGDPSYGDLTSMATDGMATVSDAPSGYIGPLAPLAIGVHTFDLSVTMGGVGSPRPFSSMPTMLGAGVTTVVSVMNPCASGAWLGREFAYTPMALPVGAQVLLYALGCDGAPVLFVLDGGAPMMASFGSRLLSNVVPGPHQLDVLDPMNVLLTSVPFDAANAETISFFYSLGHDVNGAPLFNVAVVHDPN
jgi:hypothetical protein